MEIGPTLYTERLVLRPPRREDLDGFAAFMGDEEATRFLGGPVPRSVAWRAMMAFAGSWALQGFAMFSVIERASGRWVGRLGPWMPDGWPGTEVGWSIERASWGKGYATEGAAAAIDWAFDRLGWDEVVHTIGPENAASQAVARKLGATLRGPSRLPPPYENDPVELWGQTKAEWRSRA